MKPNILDDKKDYEPRKVNRKTTMILVLVVLVVFLILFMGVLAIADIPVGQN